MHINQNDPTPPYEQVRREILHEIETGARMPGERLPSIRALASSLKLAPGTVARAYKELEDAGYVVARRGGGSHISEKLPTIRVDNYRLDQAALVMVQRARSAGFQEHEIDQAIENARRFLGDPRIKAAS